MSEWFCIDLTIFILLCVHVYTKTTGLAPTQRMYITSVRTMLSAVSISYRVKAGGCYSQELDFLFFSLTVDLLNDLANSAISLHPTNLNMGLRQWNRPHTLPLQTWYTVQESLYYCIIYFPEHIFIQVIIYPKFYFCESPVRLKVGSTY